MQLEVKNEHAITPDFSHLKGWGVERAKLTVGSFKISLVLFSIGVVLLVIYGLLLNTYPVFFHTNPLPHNSPWNIWNVTNGFYGLIFIFVFFMYGTLNTIYVFQDRTSEAIKQQKTRARNWENKVLAPYFDEKYGSKPSILRELTLDAVKFGDIMHNGKRVSVKLDGAKKVFDDTFTKKESEGTYYYVKYADEVSLSILP